MWQAIKTFFTAPLGKASALTAIKVWQVALAITVVTASAATYSYVRLNASNPVTTNVDIAQQVVVFIGGLNTTMKNCHEDTFDDDTHSNILSFLLSRGTGTANPYAKGCNELNPKQRYFSETRSIMRFSYNGGAMDPQGFWKPKDYDPCTSVNQYSLDKDIKTFDTTLDIYRQVFRNAHFIIVGHSLGGLVGLQGAYDYVVNKGNTDIDKVITIDSPLKGIQIANQNLAQFLSKHCVYSGPVVTSDLMKLGKTSINATPNDLKCDHPGDPKQAALSSCKSQQLAQRGVGVITIGNQQDSLFCGGNTQEYGGLAFTCGTQTLDNVHLTLNKLYNLHPLQTEGYAIGGLWDTDFGAGHFTLIETPERELEILRYILAPVVTINQPTFQDTPLVSSTGTGSPFSATLHCLWGMANSIHVTAQVLLKDGISLFAGTAVPTNRTNMLAVNGIVNLPLSQKNTAGMFYIEAGSDTCQYPDGTDPQVHSKAIPMDTDYFGAKTTGIPFALTSGAPTTQIYGSSSQSQPSAPNDDAKLLTRSADLTVSARQSFTVYFDYQNTGNTTWSDASGYQLVCDTKSVSGANCMGEAAQGLNGIAVPPGYQTTFYLTLTAPITPGTYQLAWSIARNGAAFGQNQVTVKVKVTPAPVVYFGVSNDVYALLASNGDQLWHYQIPKQAGSYTYVQSLIVVGKVVFTNTNDGRVYAFNTTDGSIRWQYLLATSTGASLEVVDGTVYVFSNDGVTYALNASEGALRWRYQGSTTGNNYLSGVVDSGTVYIGSSDGTVYAIKAADGRLLWHFQTENPSNSLIVSNGIICVFSRPADASDFSESFYGLRPSDGQQLWYYHIASFGNDPYPVVGNGLVYIGTLETLDVLDANTGSLRWQQKVNIVNGMTLANSIIYISAGDGGFYAYDANTGSLLWNQPVGLIDSGPLVVNNIVYISTRWNGHLYAFNATTGKPVWSYQAKSYQPDGAFVIILQVAYGSIYIDDERYMIVFNMSNGVSLWQFDHGFGGGFTQLDVSMENS